MSENNQKKVVDSNKDVDKEEKPQAEEKPEKTLEEKLADKSKELGAYFLHELSLIESDLIDHVRGKGLMIAIDLTPKAGKARQYTELLMRKGVLAKETHETIIRFAPPLTITKEELNWALVIIKEVFK